MPRASASPGERDLASSPPTSQTDRALERPPPASTRRKVLAVALEARDADQLARADLEVDRRARPRQRTPAARTTGRAGRGLRGGLRISAGGPRLRSSARRARAGCLAAGSVATLSPERRTVTRSAISSTSSMRCEMKIMPAPSAAQALEDARTGARGWRRRAPRWPRRGSAPWGRARAPGRCTSPGVAERKVVAGRRARSDVADRARPASRGRALRRSLLGTRREEPIGAEPDVLEDGRGRRRGISWKTVAMPARAPRAARRETRPAPADVDRPGVGRCTPDRIFTSVLFPEPFSPMIACTSPRRRPSEQPLAPGSPRRTSPARSSGGRRLRSRERWARVGRSRGRESHPPRGRARSGAATRAGWVLKTLALRSGCVNSEFRSSFAVVRRAGLLDGAGRRDRPTPASRTACSWPG